jgi:hypothetical protein
MIWFRLSADGRVRSIERMDARDAVLNLGAGEALLEFDADAPYRTHRWDWDRREWVDPAETPDPHDWRFMRRTGYSELIGDQLGVLMKLARAGLDGRPPSPEDRAEFEALERRITELKTDHPKD